jgi:hypothetical protein
MNRLCFVLLVAFACSATFGCNPASLSYFLFRGDGKAPAEEKAFVAKDGKREVVVLTLVTAPSGNFELAGMDRELVGCLTRCFEEQSKDKKPHVKVIESGKLDRFKSKNPSWKTMAAADIGRELGADYVMDVSITDLQLYEPGTGKLMYMGRATADVKTYDTATGSLFGNPSFVTANTESRPADGFPASQYKTQLIQRLAIRLSWKHIPHIADQRVAAGQ